jgi:hypothetical protein
VARAVTSLALTFLTYAAVGYVTADRWLTRPRHVGRLLGPEGQALGLALGMATAVFLSLAVRALPSGIP